MDVVVRTFSPSAKECIFITSTRAPALQHPTPPDYIIYCQPGAAGGGGSSMLAPDPARPRCCARPLIRLPAGALPPASFCRCR